MIFLRLAQIFLTMSNTFKLCPTDFSRGANIFLGGLRPSCAPLDTGLLLTGRRVVVGTVVCVFDNRETDVSQNKCYRSYGLLLQLCFVVMYFMQMHRLEMLESAVVTFGFIIFVPFGFVLCN